LGSSARSCCRSAPAVVGNETLFEEFGPICLDPVEVFVLQPMTAASVPEDVCAFNLERPLTVDEGRLAHPDVPIAQLQDWTALVVGRFVIETAFIGVIDLQIECPSFLRTRTMMPFGIGTLTGKRCYLKAFQNVSRENVDDYGRMIEATLCITPTRHEILVQMDDRIWVNVVYLRQKHDGTFSNLPKAKPLLG